MTAKPKFSEKSMSSIRMMELMAIYANNTNKNTNVEDMSDEDKAYLVDRAECIINNMQEFISKIRG